jgi:hypothetical protein
MTTTRVSKTEAQLNSIALASAATVTSTTPVASASSATPIATAPAPTGSAPATPAPIATASAASIFAGLGFVDRESTAVVLAIVKTIDGGQGFGLAIHLHKAEPFASPGVAVLDHLGALNGPELGEELLELRAIDLIGQITDIQLLAHRWSPGLGKVDPLETFRVEEKGAKVAQSVGRRR